MWKAVKLTGKAVVFDQTLEPLPVVSREWLQIIIWDEIECPSIFSSLKNTNMITAVFDGGLDRLYVLI